jgi:hypothetical protein
VEKDRKKHSFNICLKWKPTNTIVQVEIGGKFALAPNDARPKLRKISHINQQGNNLKNF